MIPIDFGVTSSKGKVTGALNVRMVFALSSIFHNDQLMLGFLKEKLRGYPTILLNEALRSVQQDKQHSSFNICHNIVIFLCSFVRTLHLKI
jgi:hypothetical protein